MKHIDEHIQKIQNWFKNHPKVLIALSGGVDSCLVAFMARKYLGKENAIAVISNSVSLKSKDYKDAQQFALDNDILLYEIDAKEINNPGYNSNPIDRCYYCKSNLYQSIQSLTKEKFIDYEILNGNNYSDLGDYRPGIKAAKEYKALSPLAECEINKITIRDISNHFRLSVWDKPASPCLSSRFPYGEKITIQKLKQVEQAEDFLNTKGFRDVRVRYMKGKAKIEVPKKQISLLENIQIQVSQQLKQIGFHNVTIDKEGFVSGKLNRDIDNIL
ncbi:ATP-dependent sacrificial sulfur transferase LarE [Labilibacter sediminis]|nr:ATP-dependent sacrificial sulfur transferase LarE [Labilibacter sediminis]